MFLNCHESVGDLSDGRLHGSDLSGERGLLSLSAGYGGARDLFRDGVDLAAMKVSKRLNQQDEQLIFI